MENLKVRIGSKLYYTDNKEYVGEVVKILKRTVWYKDLNGNVTKNFSLNFAKDMLNSPVKTKYKKKRDIVDFDTLTYTDVHVGMDTDKSKNSMYPIVWNKEEILKACDKIIEKTIQNKQSDTLIIDELGDFLDGYVLRK